MGSGIISVERWRRWPVEGGVRPRFDEALQPGASVTVADRQRRKVCLVAPGYAWLPPDLPVAVVRICRGFNEYTLPAHTS
jgi:hypothetical protein